MSHLLIHFGSDIPASQREVAADLLSAELAEYALGELLVTDSSSTALTVETLDESRARPLIERVLAALDISVTITK